MNEEIDKKISEKCAEMTIFSKEIDILTAGIYAELRRITAPYKEKMDKIFKEIQELKKLKETNE